MVPGLVRKLNGEDMINVGVMQRPPLLACAIGAGLLLSDPATDMRKVAEKDTKVSPLPIRFQPRRKDGELKVTSVVHGSE